MSYNPPPPPPEQRFDFKKVWYRGGHSAYPERHSGMLILTSYWLVFQEMKGLTSNKSGNFRLEIPTSQIQGSHIMKREEISRLTSIVAGPLWGVGMPIQQTFVVIEYLDNAGFKQTPLFDFSIDWGDKEKGKFLRQLYEYIKDNPKPSPPTSDVVEDPLQTLKLRYAKGEISKEQYEEMKKILS